MSTNTRLSVLVLVLLFGANLMAITMIGTPTAELKEEQWGFGFEFSYSETDFDITNGSALNDVQSEQYFFNLGYGVFDNWQVFARVGVADAKEDIVDFNGDSDLALGVGTKYTFAKSENIDWGAMCQLTWLDTNGSVAGVDAKFSTLDFQVAVGPTIDLEVCKLYGGPFLLFSQGDYDVIGLNLDIEQDSTLGGYIGGQFEIYNSGIVAVEYAFFDDGYNFGLSFGWKY